eukprot:1057521-Prymnesium_polylepis.1
MGVRGGPNRSRTGVFCIRIISKALSAYLRAMGIQLGKEEQRDAPGVKEMLRKRLRELGTDEWSLP